MHDIDVQFNNSNATISLDLVIPNDIFDIEWYLDGQNDSTLKNKTNFSIDKKSSGWEKIAYRIVEKSFPKKYLFASDDLDNYADVYDGLAHTIKLIYVMNHILMRKDTKKVYVLELYQDMTSKLIIGMVVMV